jgi:Ca-activated chloride channel homolog
MLQVAYQFSRPLIPISQTTCLDLYIQFKPLTSESHKRRPLNLSIVIDRSGSMSGQPLKQAINAARLLVEQLTPEDILSVVTYDDDVETVFEPQLVKNKDIIFTVLSKIKAGGCTNLSGGWLKGCEHVQTHQTPDKINRVLLLTDGQANVGVIDSKVLIGTAQQKAQNNQVSTTTLGFGAHFNEDLLMGMARNANGNFYFIQTPEDLVQVFQIELESISSLIAQDLVVNVSPQPIVKIEQLLNNYRYKEKEDDALEIVLGDVYEVEDKILALSMNITAPPHIGSQVVLHLNYRYQAVVNDVIQQFAQQETIIISVDTQSAFDNTSFQRNVIEQTYRLRIAKAKEDAVDLADQGDYQTASQHLHQMIDFLTGNITEESFELSEEMEQLNFFVKQLENKRYNSTLRKELKDQSYQSTHRNRHDLNLRGVSSSDAIYDLPVVNSSEQGVVLQCFREGGKLRIRVISEGYNPDLHVQFPRHIREDGASYVVDEVELSSNGTFYRAKGEIRLLVLAGQEQLYQQRKASRNGGTTRLRTPPKAATAPATAADLETIDDVGKGVLVQCVPEGKKLRARVVSDGYNPNYNIRFPRSIRELGILYVVDEVIEHPQGGSYIACGKIKRLVQ